MAHLFVVVSLMAFFYSTQSIRSQVVDESAGDVFKSMDRSMDKSSKSESIVSGRNCADTVVSSKSTVMSLFRKRKSKCTCAAEGWTLQGDAQECQPYVNTAYFPNTLPRGACKCRSPLVTCEEGVLMMTTDQPDLAKLRLPVVDRPLEFAKSEHSTGCSKVYRVSCVDGLASISLLLTCPVEPSDMVPPQPDDAGPFEKTWKVHKGPFENEWKLCGKEVKDGKLTTLRNLIDETYMDRLPIHSQISGCLRLAAPRTVPELKRMEGTWDQQLRVLQEAKDVTGSCALIETDADRFARAEDFHRKDIKDIKRFQKELMDRAKDEKHVLSGRFSLTRSTGKLLKGLFRFFTPKLWGAKELDSIDDVTMSKVNCGMPTILVNGPYKYQYPQVSGEMQNPVQERQYTSFTSKQTRSCFEPSMVLFLSTGSTAHNHFRQLMDEAGFDTLDNEELPALPEKYDGPSKARGRNSPGLSTVGFHVLSLLMKGIWQKTADERTIKRILPYLKVGKYCKFGGLIDRMGLFTRRKLSYTRRIMLEFAKDSPRYKTFKTLLSEAQQNDTATLVQTDTDSFVKNVADVVLFAGFQGTTDLATKCVESQWNSPDRKDLYRRDKVSYLQELARLNPSLPSITAAMRKATPMKLQGVELDFPAGTSVQLSITTANVDSKIFKHPQSFWPNREDLHQQLSWNGKLQDVMDRSYTKAPRFCPGYHLSMKIAIDVCDYYTAQL